MYSDPVMVIDIIDSTWCACFRVCVCACARLIACFGFQRKKCISLRFCSAGPLHTESLRLNNSPFPLKVSPSTSNMLHWNTLGNLFLTKCWLTELFFVSIVVINTWVWRKGNSEWFFIGEAAIQHLTAYPINPRKVSFSQLNEDMLYFSSFLLYPSCFSCYWQQIIFFEQSSSLYITAWCHIKIKC